MRGSTANWSLHQSREFWEADLDQICSQPRPSHVAGKWQDATGCEDWSNAHGRQNPWAHQLALKIEEMKMAKQKWRIRLFFNNSPDASHSAMPCVCVSVRTTQCQ